MAGGLATVDWAAPWLRHVAALGRRVADRCAAGESLPEALNACAPQGAPVRFVPPSALPAGRAYESYIFDSKQCPTREGLHDFFNGLIWLHLARTKARLNRLQAERIQAQGVGPERGPLRDALTLFDENGAILQAPPALGEALWCKDWSRLFGELRPLWAQSRVVLFGHALLEKLVQPRKAITAHVMLVPVGIDAVDELDAWLASALDPVRLAAKPFANLPVLGVPGWWPANELPAFYLDPHVFRPVQ